MELVIKILEKDYNLLISWLTRRNLAGLLDWLCKNPAVYYDLGWHVCVPWNWQTCSR